MTAKLVGRIRSGYCWIALIIDANPEQAYKLEPGMIS